MEHLRNIRIVTVNRMIDRSTLRLKIKEISLNLTEIEDIFSITSTESKIKELEEESQSASFWSNQNNAKKTIDELNDLKDKLSSYNELKNIQEELNLIYELSEENEEELASSESLINNFKKLYDEFSTELLLNNPVDKNNCIIDIHSGAGGTESLDWVSMLYRMYTMYAQSHKMRVDVLDLEPGLEAGIKSVTFRVSKMYAYGNLKGETGVHRLIRLSPFDSSHSRHTTFASVYVSPEVDDSFEINLKEDEIRIDIFHSSGAGGQGVNTSFSAVRVTHLPTGISVSCQNERSQIQNKETAISILKSRLYQLELDKRREEKLKNENKMDISFGSQIRTYTFHPYSLVKDHRTNYETQRVDKVMDGELDDFIKEYLKMEATK